MKKLISVILCIVCLLCLAACGNKSEGTVYEGGGTSSTDPKDVTVDLTRMSATMVYSEVSQMMTKPQSYIGNTIIMNGTFSLYYNDDKTKSYAACIVKDATACCSQGLEFLLKDGIEYPKLDDQITVKGVFELYDEDGTQYARIKDAELL